MFIKGPHFSPSFTETHTHTHTAAAGILLSLTQENYVHNHNHFYHQQQPLPPAETDPFHVYNQLTSLHTGHKTDDASHDS